MHKQANLLTIALIVVGTVLTFAQTSWIIHEVRKSRNAPRFNR